MARNYRRTGRYSRRVKTVKFSNETYNAVGTWVNTNPSVKDTLTTTLITAIDQQGVRKCKNFELTLAGGGWVHNDAQSTTTLEPIIWALVYVPQGTTASEISLGSPDGAASLYEPNQNVIMSGLWPGDLTSPYVKKTRLARNLNSGDKIELVMAVPGMNTQDTQATKELAVSLNYAISF